MAKGKYQEWLEPEGLLLIKGWARDGLIDEQIAKNMGISIKTLYNWKNDHLQILQALKESKEIADREVENALFKRALGYEYDEIKEYELPNGEIRRSVVKKQVSPDVTAQIYWLNNRKPDEWRNKRDINTLGQEENSIKIELVGDIGNWAK